jgi:hypothetical protein
MCLLLNDRVALATDRTGVNTPNTMFPDSGPIDTRFFRNRQPMSPARGSTSGLPVIPDWRDRFSQWGPIPPGMLRPNSYGMVTTTRGFPGAPQFSAIAESGTVFVWI